MTGYLEWLLAFASFVAYGRAIHSGFDRDGPMPVAMRGLALFGTVLAAVSLTLLLLQPRSEPPLRWLAQSALSAGLLLFGWARVTLRGTRLFVAFTRHTPSMLVTSGPWRWIRHPHYAAYLLTWAGLSVLTSSVIVAGGTFVLAWWYTQAARQEERAFLASPLADEYAAYRRSTGMFLPAPWRSR